MFSVPSALDGLGDRRQGFRPALRMELGNGASPFEGCPITSECPNALWFRLANPLQQLLAIYWVDKRKASGP